MYLIAIVRVWNTPQNALNLIKYQFVSSDELVFGNNEMVGSVKKGDSREFLLEDATHMSGEELFSKYFPDTVKIRLKRHLRLFLVHTGLYNFFKYRLFIYRRNKSKK